MHKFANKFAAVILVLVSVPVLSACSQMVPVENVVSASLGAPAGVTMAQVDAMIEDVCFRRNWEIREKASGDVTATYSVSAGKHKVTARITYDTSKYSITYVDSHNMNFRPVGATGQIHPKYNIWVTQIRQDIEARAAEL